MSFGHHLSAIIHACLKSGHPLIRTLKHFDLNKSPLIKNEIYIFNFFFSLERLMICVRPPVPLVCNYKKANICPFQRRFSSLLNWSNWRKKKKNTNPLAFGLLCPFCISLAAPLQQKISFPWKPVFSTIFLVLLLRPIFHPLCEIKKWISPILTV
jgi:hypothetical protein